MRRRSVNGADDRQDARKGPEVNDKTLAEDTKAKELSLEEFSKLVALVYEGLREPVQWGGLLTALKRHLNTNWATVILRPASLDQPALLIRVGERGAEIYGAAYNQYNVFSMDPFVGLPPDQVVTLDEMIDPKTWVQGEFYRQFIEPNNIRHILGLDLRADDGAECRLRMTRPEGTSNFSAAEKRVFQMLLPHIKCAVNLRSHFGVIESERRLYATAVDRMLVGTLILDKSGAVIRSNRVADEILVQKDGLHLSMGSLHADYRQEDRELQHLLKTALSPGHAAAPSVPEAIAVTRPSGRAKLGVVVRSIPLGEWSEGQHRPAVAVFIRDPERKSQASNELLRQLFGFTPAEATLALLLANGLTLDEAAEELHIRKNTIRAHLRSIFTKTGVTRQTTLVRLLLSSVA
jgi:DNA-binding CsgD family transcriptional regulator